MLRREEVSPCIGVTWGLRGESRGKPRPSASMKDPRGRNALLTEFVDACNGEARDIDHAGTSITLHFNVSDKVARQWQIAGAVEVMLSENYGF